MKSAIGKGATAALACCAMAGAAQAQTVTAGPASSRSVVEKGPRAGSFGARVSVNLIRHKPLTFGVETGYAQLGDIAAPDDDFEFGPERPVGNERISRKLWYAAASARRDWGAGRVLGAYAGGASGLYVFRRSIDQWRSTTDFVNSHTAAATLGLNAGAGLALRPWRGTGSIDLDARVHLMPFAQTMDTKSIFTVSAGIRFF